MMPDAPLAAVCLMAVMGALIVSAVQSKEEVSANAFHEYCGRCHALPDVRAMEPPEGMYKYARVFGASKEEVAEIRAYIRSIRDE